ncbi:MAG: putative permease [uncultured archaeon A07HB70]|nr:MAG: putative permease [uncultured archaeon A07HB70]
MGLGTLGPTGLLVLAGVVAAAGAVNGVAGFGFALVATTTLATLVDPTTAVVFVILPVVAVNGSLVRELSAAEVRQCGRRFWPLLAAALVGTLVGLAALGRLPADPLRVALGVLSVGFVAGRVAPLPGRRAVEERCFVETGPAMAGVGLVSGLLFGGTNVGVQLIAYLRSCDLPHRTFVGVVALAFLGLNGVRVGAAALLGLYPSAAVALASAAAAGPALAGVAVGKRLRSRVTERWRARAVLGLLLVVGVRLVTAGL